MPFFFFQKQCIFKNKSKRHAHFRPFAIISVFACFRTLKPFLKFSKIESFLEDISVNSF